VPRAHWDKIAPRTQPVAPVTLRKRPAAAAGGDDEMHKKLVEQVVQQLKSRVVSVVPAQREAMAVRLTKVILNAVTPPLPADVRERMTALILANVAPLNEMDTLP
jgi:hypothetical protein